MGVSLKKVTSAAEILKVSELAHEIWREHYGSLLPAGQVEYMLEKIQSPGPIQQQIADGYDYYLITKLGTPVGYTAVKPNDPAGELFLSKLYVRREERGHGVAKAALSEIDELARKANLSSMWLTVNKGNSSIAAYEKLGFVNERPLVTDIGGGYVMDDYVMRRTVPQGN